jgi:hypothetical protein
MQLINKGICVVGTPLRILKYLTNKVALGSAIVILSKESFDLSLKLKLRAGIDDLK